jgi:Ca2+-binding EF-hand superfamily protein
MVKDDNLIKMFNIFDENKDHKLSLEEFCNSVHFLNITKNFIEVDCLEVREAFKAFDTNNDGKISLQGTPTFNSGFLFFNLFLFV